MTMEKNVETQLPEGFGEIASFIGEDFLANPELQQAVTGEFVRWYGERFSRSCMGLSGEHLAAKVLKDLKAAPEDKRAQLRADFRPARTAFLAPRMEPSVRHHASTKGAGKSDPPTYLLPK